MSARTPGPGEVLRRDRVEAAAVIPARGPADRAPATTTTIIVAGTLLALFLRLYELLRPGMLLGVHQYDDGVYLGAAIRLAHGVVPYRDFAFVQPPGIALLLAPLGFLAKLTGAPTAMAIARLLTAVVGAVAVLLAGILVRHRGPVAVALTCAIVAAHPDSVYATQTLLLEPYLVLFCLLGAIAAFEGDTVTADRRRLLLAGLAMGVAGTIKAFAIFPAVALLAVCGFAGSWRRAGRYAAGVVIGFAVPALPFIVLSPRGFFDGVIRAQFGRTDLTHVSALMRLRSLFGLSHLHAPAASVTLVVVLVVVTVVACLAAAWLIAKQPPPVLDLFALLASVVIVLGFFVPRDFYAHYADLFTPFLAMCVGLSVGRLLTVATGWSPAAGGSRLAVIGAGAVIAVIAAAVGMADADLGWEHHLHAHPPPAVVDRLIPAGACVLTDKASLTILANRFTSHVPGCSQMVDALGTDLSLGSADNGLTGAGRRPAVERAWLSAFRHAEYVWLACSPAGAPGCDTTTNRRIPWTPPILGYFTMHFHRLARRGFYARNGVGA